MLHYVLVHLIQACSKWSRAYAELNVYWPDWFLATLSQVELQMSPQLVQLALMSGSASWRQASSLFGAVCSLKAAVAQSRVWSAQLQLKLPVTKMSGAASMAQQSA